MKIQQGIFTICNHLVFRIDDESVTLGDPLHSTTPVSTYDANDTESVPLTLHTEVWAWGRNDCGQLGMSDLLDR